MSDLLQRKGTLLMSNVGREEENRSSDDDYNASSGDEPIRKSSPLVRTMAAKDRKKQLHGSGEKKNLKGPLRTAKRINAAGTKKASTHTKDVATALPTRCISESSGGEDKMGWGEPKKSKKKKAGGMGGGWGGDSESQSDSGVEGNVMGWGGSAKQKERMTTDSDSDSMSLFQRYRELGTESFAPPDSESTRWRTNPYTNWNQGELSEDEDAVEDEVSVDVYPIKSSQPPGRKMSSHSRDVLSAIDDDKHMMHFGGLDAGAFEYEDEDEADSDDMQFAHPRSNAPRHGRGGGQRESRMKRQLHKPASEAAYKPASEAAYKPASEAASPASAPASRGASEGLSSRGASEGLFRAAGTALGLERRGEGLAGDGVLSEAEGARRVGMGGVEAEGAEGYGEARGLGYQGGISDTRVPSLGVGYQGVLYSGEKQDRWGLSGASRTAVTSVFGNVEVSEDGIVGGGSSSKPSFFSRFGNIQLAGPGTLSPPSPSPVPSAHSSITTESPREAQSPWRVTAASPPWRVTAASLQRDAASTVATGRAMRGNASDEEERSSSISLSVDSGNVSDESTEVEAHAAPSYMRVLAKQPAHKASPPSPSPEPVVVAKADGRGEPVVVAKAGGRGEPVVVAKAGGRGEPVVVAKAGGRGEEGKPQIGKAEVEAALSRFGNVKLFSLDDEMEDNAGGVGYASEGSLASLDHHGYRASSLDSSETPSATSSNLNTPRGYEAIHASGQAAMQAVSKQGAAMQGVSKQGAVSSKMSEGNKLVSSKLASFGNIQFASDLFAVPEAVGEQLKRGAQAHFSAPSEPPSHSPFKPRGHVASSRPPSPPHLTTPAKESYPPRHAASPPDVRRGVGGVAGRRAGSSPRQGGEEGFEYGDIDMPGAGGLLDMSAIDSVEQTPLKPTKHKATRPDKLAIPAQQQEQQQQSKGPAVVASGVLSVVADGGERMLALENRLRLLEERLGESGEGGMGGTAGKDRRRRAAEWRAVEAETEERRAALEGLLAKSYSVSKACVVDLGGCKLTRIPHALLRSLGCIASLRLDRNEIRDLPMRALRHLPRLKELSVKDNLISRLPPSLFSLPLLETLDLSNNRVAWLSRDVSGLVGLTRLNMANNRLSMVPSSMFEMPGLVHLSLAGNSLPPHLVTSDPRDAKEGGGKGEEESGGWSGPRRVLKEAGAVHKRLGVVVGERGCWAEGGLGRLLGMMLSGQTGCDCEIASGIDGTRIGAHQSVLLCRAAGLHARLQYKTRPEGTWWGVLMEERGATLAQLLWWVYTDTLPDEGGPLPSSSSSSVPSMASGAIWSDGRSLRVHPLTTVGAHELGLLASRLNLPRLQSMCAHVTSKASTMFSRVLLRSYDLIDQEKSMSLRPVPASSMHADITGLINNHDASPDIRLEAADGHITCHSFLAAAHSTQLAAVLLTSRDTGSCARFTLTKMHPTLTVAQLRPLVRFMYGARLSDVLSELQGGHTGLIAFLACCRALEVSPSVSAHVESRLLACLAASNAADILEASLDWYCKADAEAAPRAAVKGGLTAACLKVIAENASHVKQTKGWKGMREEIKRFACEYAKGTGMGLQGELQ